MGKTDKAIDDLYGLPLEEFTGARNSLAKQLRGDGEKELAGEVAKLPKPSRPAWAINRAVRDQADLVDTLLEAASELAGAQEAAVKGSGREALDDAVSDERAAVEAFVGAARKELDAAGSASSAMVDRVRKTLRAAAGDPDLRAELEAGRVVTDREPVGFGVAAPAGKRARPKPKREAAAKKSDGDQDEEPQVSRAALADARKRVSRAKRRVESGESAVEHSAQRLESARERFESAGAKLAEQEAELVRRRQELGDAQAVLDELTAS